MAGSDTKVRSLENRDIKLILSGLAFVIPLYDKLVVYFIALLIVRWLISKDWKRRLGNLQKDNNGKFLLLFTALYIVYWIGLLYTRNFPYAWFDLATKVSLLIFPLIFSTLDKNEYSQKDFHQVLSAFVAGCFAITLILFFGAIMNYLKNPIVSTFFYTSLSAFLHPSYLSMYLVFAVTVLIYFLINQRLTFSGKVRFLLFLLMLYFLTVILLLSSKAGILSIVTVFIISLAIIIFRRRNYVVGIPLLVTLITLLVVGYFFLPSVFLRFSEAGKVVKGRQEISTGSSDGTAERILIWKASLEIIRLHPIAGVGTGDVKDKLLQYYQEKGITDALSKKLNAHCQYLQTTISLGIIGLLFLAAGLLIPLWLSARERNLLLFLFILIIGFNFLVESMLERQSGVVFYGFFNSFLFFLGRNFRNS